MNATDDPFVAFEVQTREDDFSVLAQRPLSPVSRSLGAMTERLPGPAIGRLHGFDMLERPLVSGLQAFPGQVVPARSAVGLRNGMLGREVVVLFENGDAGCPIIMGVLEPHPHQEDVAAADHAMQVEADGERRVIEAEREIVLRCGDASITLTRAGKVIIRGTYIMSRSSGYNKIKGAAVDIN